MTTVEEAKILVAQFNPNLKTFVCNVPSSSGMVLAEDVLSPIHMPPFAQSAMDGYALGDGSRVQGSTFKVVGEAAAGSGVSFQLKQGEAVRIFTGAPVPATATAIVQQEWIERNENTITLQREVPDRMHIRSQGEQMQKGDVAIEKGTLITPATIGFLSMLGITTVPVFEKPKITVLVTGNELVSPGLELQYGQIFESNSTMLIAALAQEGVEAKSERVADNLDETIEKIGQAMAKSDIIILSGGISVGDHDHVRTALAELRVNEEFYKVAQKPGKPIFFGTKGQKAVFALPGNPAASLSCFYEYVLPVVRKFYGHQDIHLPSFKLPIADGVIRKMDRAQFLKAKVENGKVHVLEGQSSAMLNTFALSNAQVYIPANSQELKQGDFVEVHLLP
ncbi:MAG: molybdopterin molybdotransferase MoeA [Flavobacteriales bacterium]|jgi:molybdopterin molybdotransferase|nr:molybdopterin molybdotransferase MoeA [Flavobacteriales bacterium]